MNEVTVSVSPTRTLNAKEARLVENQAIIACLRHGGMIHDDHTGGRIEVAQAVAQKGEHLVPLYSNHPMYSLNKLYLKDGKVRLSRTSVGTLTKNQGDDFQKTVEVYNASQKTALWASAELTNLVVF